MLSLYEKIEEQITKPLSYDIGMLVGDWSELRHPLEHSVLDPKHIVVIKRLIESTLRETLSEKFN